LREHLSEVQPSSEEASGTSAHADHDVPNRFTDPDMPPSFVMPVQAKQRHIIVRSNKRSSGGLYSFGWILLILLVSVAILIGSAHNYSASGSGRPLDDDLGKIIPSDPLRRPPIDTTKLVKGEDGASKIVANIFNISLKNRSGDFAQFAVDLKKAFPDTAYRIVYFDTSTARLQFQFPDTARNTLKDKIRDALKDYDLLIWDESIFSLSKTYNDPIFSDSSRSWHLFSIGAPAAWDISSGSPDVVVAVIDDGFDLANSDLGGRLVKPYNVVTRNAVITSSASRIHGTHVAGIAIGRANNASGIVGVAPDCSFMPVQIAQDGEAFTTSDVIDGILYAIRSGADVINLSLGKYLPDELASLTPEQQQELAGNIGKDEQLFWDELFDYADREGVIIVMASGNQHMLTGLDPMQRSAKSIKVSATDAHQEATSFTNFGSSATIYAPGERIFSIVPGNKEQFMDGTSMASPIIAGAVALLKSKKKDISLPQVVNLMHKTGIPIVVKGQDARLIQLDKMLQSL
jgi:subtilisin family serine protease